MEVGSSSLPGTTSNLYTNLGGLAQLARAPALQAGGQRFESVILHVFVRKRIDAVNPISDTLMMDGVNPALDTVGVPKRKRSLTY